MNQNRSESKLGADFQIFLPPPRKFRPWCKLRILMELDRLVCQFMKADILEECKELRFLICTEEQPIVLH